MLKLLSIITLSLLIVAMHAAPQWPTPFNTYSWNNPTFSSLSTTPYPYYYNPYTTASPNTDTQIRIWPYVIGQYLYPAYSNPSYYNPYGTYGTTNLYGYQTNFGK